MPRGCVVDLGNVLGQTISIQERGDGNGFLGFLVDHQRHADAAVRVASAGELTPIRVRSVHQIAEIGEGAHKADGEPVAGRLAESRLVLDVVRHVAQRVALRQATLVGDVLVAAGEGNRLEGEEVDLLRIVEGELDDAADLLVVDAVDDGRDGNDVDAGFVQVVDGLQLHVKQVADLAVRVGCVADAVELQIDVAQTGFGSGAAKLLRLGKFNSVGRRLDRVVTNLARVGDGIQEVGRQGGLAAGELNAHLAARLDLRSVVEHGLDLFPRQLVDKANLVGIHEAGIAHHVAAVGQIDRQNRATSVGHGRGAVVVQLFVVVRADVAAREDLFQVLEELGVDRHHVFKVAVLGAILDHQDLAVALDDLRLDLADLLIQKDFVGQLAVDDLLADLRNALGTERIGRARPAKRRLLLLVGLQQRLIGPLRA